MKVLLKDLAQSLDIEEDRLILLFDDAGVPGMTSESEVTPIEKMKLVRSMQTGRVQIRAKSSNESVESHGRTGTKREVKIKVVDGSVLAPRGVLKPPINVQPDQPEPEVEEPEVAETSEVEPEVHEDVAVADQEIEVADDKSDETEPVVEPEIAAADEEPQDLEPVVEEVADSGTEPAVEVAEEAPTAKETEAPKKPPAKKAKPKRKAAPKGEAERREKLHIARGRRKPSRERDRKSKSSIGEERYKQHQFSVPQKPIVVEVAVSDSNAIGDLARAMSVKAGELIKKLFEVGQVVTINDSIDKDVAYYLIEEMGHVPVELDTQDLEASLVNRESDDRVQQARSPVVAVMGHVDHGKTTLLDCIRSTKVAAGEKGGITQHIGAYVVKTSKGNITFFDTPGHEAFAAMRVRGAQATDIVVLVVAADDGVKPQTVEAINHARSANVPIIVAINKIDKDKSNPDRVLRELTEHNVIAEDLGGDVLVARVSALKGDGVDDLLEMIELQSEVLDLQAPNDGPASGVVIEARVDRGRGAVVTVLVQKGQLANRDFIVAGVQKGRVRELRNDRGAKVRAAGPSTPVEIVGFQEVPIVGDDLICVPDDRTAQQLSDLRREKVKTSPGLRPTEIAFASSNEPEILNVLIKADVRGSAEALSNAVANLSNEEVEVKVIHDMVGGISLSDVNLAQAADAVIIAFNVRAEATARQAIDNYDIQVIYCGVIYDAIDAMKELISSRMEPVTVEEVVAQVEVREVFKLTKIGTIAGCYVQEGTVRSNLPVRVLRNNVLIHNGVIDSLRRFKNDVPEVRAGLECGIQLRNYHDINTDDQLEVYQSREVS